MSSTKRAASPLEAVREDDSSDSSDDDGPMPMPAAGAAEGGASSGADPGAKRKKRKLAHEKAYLDKLPSAEMYEKSYMHRDVVTHVTVTAATGFIVTASSDGHVKFWKKMMEGVEFVKHFHAHLGAIHALEASPDGLRIATTGADKAVKFFEVVSFDMSNMLRLDFIPTAACWCHARGSPVGRIAVAALDSPLVRLYATEGAVAGEANVPVATVALHKAPVVTLTLNERCGVVVSGDAKGVLEYWVPGAAAPDAGEAASGTRGVPLQGGHGPLRPRRPRALLRSGLLPGRHPLRVTASDKQVG